MIPQPLPSEPLVRVSPQDPSDREVVLLVDSEPLGRGLLADHLRRSGLKVVEAASGSEALRAFDANEVWLLFTCVRLRGYMDGLELAAHLLEVRPNLAVVYADYEFPALGRATGGHFVRKPLKPIEITALLTGIRERRA
jgi:CheY-like chemotaxis protein